MRAKGLIFLLCAPDFLMYSFYRYGYLHKTHEIPIWYRNERTYVCVYVRKNHSTNLPLVILPFLFVGNLLLQNFTVFVYIQYHTVPWYNIDLNLYKNKNINNMERSIGP